LIRLVMNMLFICSRNKKRSRTAEMIFRDVLGHKVWSAGTEANAVVRVSEKMISHADMIFVMEKVHKDKLQYQFGDLLADKTIMILDIPDEYEYMDEELVTMLKDMMEPYW